MKTTHFPNGVCCGGTSVPRSGLSGYSPGTLYSLKDASLGQAPAWINIGTYASCLFVPFGPVMGYGVHAVGGPLDCTNGSTTSNMLTGMVNPTDLCFAGMFESDDNDQVQCTVPAGKNYALVTNSADPLNAHDFQVAVLRDNCVPGWDIFAAGTYTPIAGDTTTITITVTGALAGDLAFATYGSTDDTDVIQKCVVSANTLVITASADPAASHTIHYVIFRPRGSFKPSHYIAYAGTETPLDAATATLSITVTGAAVGDIPILSWHTSDDTDTILSAAVTANTLTAVLSADPAVAHAVNYMLLRAY